jgi:tripartite-type tricarboxylate transporter receptor subunit TctC
VKLPRRQFLHLAAGATALSGVSRPARGQVYPTRPVRIIVAFSAGGGLDIVARLMGQWLSERLGQAFVIENPPGAGGNTGTEAVVSALLLLVALPNTINATLYDKLNFDFTRDIAPVASMIRQPLVMLVNPSVPAKTVPEFIAYAKANPGKVNMASSGIGSANHLSGEMFKAMTGVDMIHIPYRADVFSDLISGQVQVYFGAVAASVEYIRAGRLRAVAVTTATRSAALPDLPAIGEFVPGYEWSSWYGIGAPKRTPADIVDTLNRAVNAGLADAKLKARFADLGAVVLAGTPADFGKFLAEETEKCAKAVKFAGIKAE